MSKVRGKAGGEASRGGMDTRATHTWTQGDWAGLSTLWDLPWIKLRNIKNVVLLAQATKVTTFSSGGGVGVGGWSHRI